MSGDLVRDRWPVLADQVAAALVAEGETDLLLDWAAARFVADCGCGDGFCQSFATQPRPRGPFGRGHRCVLLAAPWDGELILDVVGETIMFVEILGREPLS